MGWGPDSSKKDELSVDRPTDRIWRELALGMKETRHFRGDI